MTREINKELVRCTNCGTQWEIEELMEDGEFGLCCPECGRNKFFRIGTDNKVVNGVELQEELEEEEEEVLVECKYCGDEFEPDEEGDDICPGCQESIDEFGNETLMYALMEEFSCNPQDIVDMGNERVQIEGREYDLLTDDEATERAGDSIKETLWAFNASFLAGETGIPEEMFEAVQENGRCESNNDAVERCIDVTCGMDDFIDSVIRADGRGHYISLYDGDEIEIDVNGEYMYLYRQD